MRFLLSWDFFLHKLANRRIVLVELVTQSTVVSIVGTFVYNHSFLDMQELLYLVWLK